MVDEVCRFSELYHIKPLNQNLSIFHKNMQGRYPQDQDYETLMTHDFLHDFF